MFLHLKLWKKGRHDHGSTGSPDWRLEGDEMLISSAIREGTACPLLPSISST